MRRPRARGVGPVTELVGAGRPIKLHADECYDVFRGSAAICAAEGSPPGSLASPGTPAPAWGRHRWVVERTLGWLLSYKRLALHGERRTAAVP